jgi:hypothetical protein
MDQWEDGDLDSCFEIKSIILHVRKLGESSNDVPYSVDRICLIFYKNQWHVFSLENVQDFERDMYSDDYVDTNNLFIDFSVESEPYNNFQFDQSLSVETNIKKWWDDVQQKDETTSLRVHMLVYERSVTEKSFNS